jgi:hypothetical protein
VRGRRRWIWKGGAIVLFAIAAIGVLSWVVMSLWNLLVPSLFHGPAVGFWQAAGLLVLSRILFGGLRGRGGPRGHWGHQSWREQMWRERWEKMTPEERRQLRAKFGRFGGRCGWSMQPEEASQTPQGTQAAPGAGNDISI